MGRVLRIAMNGLEPTSNEEVRTALQCLQIHIGAQMDSSLETVIILQIWQKRGEEKKWRLQRKHAKTDSFPLQRHSGPEKPRQVWSVWKIPLEM